MSWWTTVPGLTPVAAFDAGRTSGVQMLDGIGVNHLSSTENLVSSDFIIKKISGNSSPLSFASSISLPTTGVVAMLIRPQRRFVGLECNTGGYLFNQEANGLWYNSAASNYNTYNSTEAIFGTMAFVALVISGGGAELYVNGVSTTGSPVSPAYLPTVVNIVGYHAAEYCLDSDEYLSAVGFWNGSANADDLIALESACRFELAGSQAQFRGYASELGRSNPSPIQASDAQRVRQRFHSHLAQNTVLFDGLGQITGTVKNAPTTPVRRRVVLIDEVTRKTARETWSDASTGSYTFAHVDLGRTYTVLSYDHTQVYRAVVADRVVPELMTEQSP